MEQANLLVNTHSAAIIIVLLLIVLVALGMCFSLQGRLNKLQKKYDFFTQGKEANIDVVLTDTLQELRAVRAEAEAQVAYYDYAAAVDRFKAAQDLARKAGAGADYFEASIIDTRLRAVDELLREQLRDKAVNK